MLQIKTDPMDAKRWYCKCVGQRLWEHRGTQQAGNCYGPCVFPQAIVKRCKFWMFHCGVQVLGASGDEHEATPTLLMNGAVFVCTWVTLIGHQMCDCDISMPSILNWRHERFVCHEGILVTECGDDSRAEFAQGQIPESCDAFTPVICFTMLGDWAARRGRLSCCVNMGTVDSLNIYMAYVFG